MQKNYKDDKVTITWITMSEELSKNQIWEREVMFFSFNAQACCCFISGTQLFITDGWVSKLIIDLQCAPSAQPENLKT